MGNMEPEDFQVNGVWSEDRMCQLMETKIRLAEQVKDSVCGQFQWIYSSHDNPGRRQPDEAYRQIDKVGPFNYKGYSMGRTVGCVLYVSCQLCFRSQRSDGLSRIPYMDRPF